MFARVAWWPGWRWSLAAARYHLSTGHRDLSLSDTCRADTPHTAAWGLADCDLIFTSFAKRHRALFFGGGSEGCLRKGDARLRPVLFPTQRPSLLEQVSSLVRIRISISLSSIYSHLLLTCHTINTVRSVPLPTTLPPDAAALR